MSIKKAANDLYAQFLASGRHRFAEVEFYGFDVSAKLTDGNLFRVVGHSNSNHFYMLISSHRRDDRLPPAPARGLF